MVLKRNVPEAAKLTWEGAQLKIEMARPRWRGRVGRADATDARAATPTTPAARRPRRRTHAAPTLPRQRHADAADAAADAGDARRPARGAPAAAERANAVPTEAPAAPAPIKTAGGRAGRLRPVPRRSGRSRVDRHPRRGRLRRGEVSTRAGASRSTSRTPTSRNILRLIAEVSDLNVIAGQEVTGKVTIRLVDVPWDQALDVILLTKGLGFVRIGNILRIAPVDDAQDRRARLACRSAARARSSRTWS